MSLDPPPALDAGLDLPYLVYGTLRPGGSNVHRVERHGATHEGRVVLTGFTMLDSPRGYPYITPGRADQRIVVDVVRPPASASARLRLRRDLDALEDFVIGGTVNNYERVATAFDDPIEGRRCWGWLYVAGAGALIDGLPEIASGDWFVR
ncbi:gamma-glutamylcyclotransferase family protein [Demequina sp. NBRC 110056]|uniref:gamma-glutamylcyclotransferase family protein n=1 Tax=Demequina sp. NBRC 110056 TaxID=1570345 RepID=UPI000A062EE5|nr:gamma-glutamylcyclotransferase family protein [Demequina sp. NBRC 110056]